MTPPSTPSFRCTVDDHHLDTSLDLNRRSVPVRSSDIETYLPLPIFKLCLKGFSL